MSNQLSIRQWLARAPDPLLLLLCWQSLRERGIIAKADRRTVDKWLEVVLANACEYMRQYNNEALFTYNTLFTLFKAPTNKLFLQIATTYQTRAENALRAQQSTQADRQSVLSKEPATAG